MKLNAWIGKSGRTAGAISLLGAALAGAQTGGTPVTGKVQDEFAVPMKGCVVSLAGIAASDTTDVQGQFEVGRPPSGTIGKARAAWKGNPWAEDGTTAFDLTGRRIELESMGRTYVAGVRDPGAMDPAYTNPPGSTSGGRESLGKAAAAVDTLIVRCPDFLEKRLTALASPLAVTVQRHWDLVVYGGASGGVIAAVQAVRMGKKVVLVASEKRLGGLTTGGLGETDIGNKAAIGGLSRDFYRRIAAKYQADSAWVHQTKASYPRFSTTEMWTFEPKVASAVFRDYIAENKVPVFYGERLDLAKGVVKDGRRIVSMMTESGKVFTGRMFIDATYEGDLMAKAGVSYAVGREANSLYGETFNGIQTARAVKHQLQPGISPYVKAGDASSGLLPGVFANAGGADGAGDRKVQAYNFRMTLTTVAANRIPFPKPEGYDEKLYEILFRHIEAGFTRTDFFNYGSMPNRKTDSNNDGGFSTDFIGMNYDYPDGDHAARERIRMAHETYQKGFLWTLANHPRIPQAIRDKYSLWGLSKDEFPETGNWTPQLYVREARRMVGAMVMTQKHVTQAAKVTNPVGMGAYTMDSHNVQRHVNAAGHLVNEGDVQEKGFGPYPIDFGSLVPKAAECSNLLVPFCLSASHIAFGSIRMEPVYMVLGQSAATIAAHAIDEGVDVQSVDYAKLKARLLADKQVLSLDPVLEGIVLDDVEAALVGTWSAGAAAGSVGPSYKHDGNANKGAATAEFSKTLTPGRYEVRFYWVAHANRATNVQVRVAHSGGEALVLVNEQDADEEISLGTFDFGATGRVKVTNADSDGYVVIDGVSFIKR